MRGFLGGVSVGAILAVIGAGTLSLVTPLPQRPDVTVAAPSGTDEPATGETGVLQPAGTDADLVEAEPTAPEPAQNPSGDLSALDSADTDPADKPAVGGATEGLEAPGEESAAGISAAPDAPLQPQDPVSAPSAPAVPESESGASAETDPGEPPAPEVSDSDDTTAGETSEPAQDTALLVEGQNDQEDQPSELTGELPDEDQAEASEPAPSTDVTEAPQAPQAPSVDEEAAPRIAALPQAGTEAVGSDSGPQVGEPVVPLTERNTAPDAAADPSVAPGNTPIKAYATPFENPDNRPVMSILLIDDAGSVGGEALMDFPYPLTFALDPDDPSALEKMATYRAAGFEVVLMANLPSGSNAVDAETALEVWFKAVPETVALMEGTGSGIQGNRELSDQVTAVVKASGRGLITQDRGLNTVQKLAARDGVPSGVVFRDFDGAGQTPTVMRRFLDQAAFRAGQLGGVIMLGRVQPDTISALLLWGLQDRASRVSLAPVSATIQRDIASE
ncbi:MAG: divergent polysaccharide deacetylase family protein [Paracoccaceae bacterium]